MEKDIKNREDLIGSEIVYNGRVILISEAHERTFSNPNVKEWHGKKIYSIAGYYDLEENEQGVSVGKYTRIDILKEEAEFISEDTL
jgi:hypothetical protein